MSWSVCRGGGGDIGSGSTHAVGGLRLCAIPVLVEVLQEAGTGELEAVSNNAGVDNLGP